ncbi:MULTISPECIES: hypothetical protein [Azospirillum]|uniref:Uncharacterized protein n=2 Tax=Azospirillum brasilense TaxID=192 RepID=A0ABU4P753_AZOBR|nr:MULTISPECIES: hypothetical protein [Azospirillum]MDW7557908.1 hypothetical protein [Azospirillum brasilense]MDW7597497.1 hypothetical protein [Azospirillum brasilense]MDW7632725.1 hypothetical protein [Azospirillum brasilense]MDX5953074.1 hypothetical protein [Azospirillum brasilense]
MTIAPTAQGRMDGRSETVVGLGTANGLTIYDQGAAYEVRTGNDPNGATADVVIGLDPTYRKRPPSYAASAFPVTPSALVQFQGSSSPFTTPTPAAFAPMRTVAYDRFAP